ncbi:hypothetical protein RUM43_003131 [Polyplax serrata]|uniref:C2H2-type domain-containing protein n=1 Tax=Polyplax serrata TaxID=468196 RepID=A0AAN8NZN9_POLSC
MHSHVINHKDCIDAAEYYDSRIWPDNFFVLKQLRMLKNRVPEKAFACFKCGNRYVRKHALKSHLRWECGMPPQFQCLYCGYQCKLKHHLKSHISRMHNIDMSCK